MGGGVESHHLSNREYHSGIPYVRRGRKKAAEAAGAAQTAVAAETAASAAILRPLQHLGPLWHSCGPCDKRGFLNIRICMPIRVVKKSCFNFF